MIDFLKRAVVDTNKWKDMLGNKKNIVFSYP